MELSTAACGLLGCKAPVVLAGMGGVARSELVAAVTEAGGFGFLGMVRESPRLIRNEIAAVRRRTDRPFGVNLIPAATAGDLFEAELNACLQAQVHAVALFWDLSVETVKRLRGEGVLVVCQVGSVAEAQAAEEAGADILIVQGVEAGGHVRGVTPREALLAAVLPVVDCPVLAAGGLCDGRDLASVLAMGAQGVVFGTAFLATEESFAHTYHKQRIVEADGETVHTQAFHLNWPPGAAVRVLPNSVTRGERGDPFVGPPQPIGAEGERPIYLFSTDSPLRSMTGDFEAMALYAGEGARRIDAIVPAAERVRAILAEARAALKEAQPLSNPQATDPSTTLSDPTELARELNALLEAERAGAQVAASLVAEASDPESKALAEVIRADEVRWCRAMIDALTTLQAETFDKVGDFYGKAMAIPGWDARLALVNRGQAWVVRKLQALLPRVQDQSLRATLIEMLEAHERDIDSAQAALAERPAP